MQNTTCRAEQHGRPRRAFDRRAAHAGRGLALILATMLASNLTVAAPADVEPADTLARLTAAAVPQPHRLGQSVTVLPDGRWLFVGGTTEGAVSDALDLEDGPLHETLPVRLGEARQRHTATVLPDGRVVVIGGLDRDGQPIGTIEIVDPEEGTVVTAPVRLGTPRSAHTATLLTSGEVLIVGGRDAAGHVLGTAERWDPRTGRVTPVTTSLTLPRAAHDATLLASGEDRFVGGLGATGNPVDRDELYDPHAGLFEGPFLAHDPRRAAEGLTRTQPPAVAETLPAANAIDVPLDAWVGVRFTQAIPIEKLTASMLTLIGPEGVVASRVSGAERGRLAFLVPAQELRPATTYTLFIGRVTTANGQALARNTLRFTTVRYAAPAAAGAPQHSAGTASLVVTSRPSARGIQDHEPLAAERRRHETEERPPTPVDEQEDWTPTEANHFGRWRVLGLAQDPGLHRDLADTSAPVAPAHTTAVSGRVVRVNGRPLAHVTVGLGRIQTVTDENGWFLLSGLAAGRQSLKVDGRAVLGGGRHYAVHYLAVDVVAGQTTPLANAIYLSRIDPATEVGIDSPARREVVLTHPAIPGLEIHVPKGAVIRDQDGKVVRTLSLTPVANDRAPYPSPVPFSTYFTLQPGGAYVDGGPEHALRIVYPNHEHLPAGSRVDFWNYDIATGWQVYGHGTVTADARQIVPDSGAGLRRVMTFGIGVGQGGNAPPATAPPPGDDCKGGDPVDCPTGIFLHGGTDLRVNDVLPIQVSRVYRTNDNQSRAFGVGTNLGYSLTLFQTSAASQQELDVVLPDGGKLPFFLVSGSNPSTWTHTSTPTEYFGATLVLVNTPTPHWVLTRRDGTQLTFLSENVVASPLSSIRDRNGNTITLTYAHSTNTNAYPSVLTQITSPSGRYIRLFYDSFGRINLAEDDAGRQVSYAYDAQNHLSSVTDANGKTEQYGYDPVTNNMNLVTDRRGNAMVQNVFDANGRVLQQTLADGAIWKFSYALNPNGTVAQTTVTDPRQYVRQISMTPTGYPSLVVSALGKPEQQTVQAERDSANRPLTVMDALGRTTTYGYNAAGDLTSVTLLTGTPNAVSYEFGYEPVFHQLASITDPLGHTTTVRRDAAGNATGVTDPLGHTTSVQYNELGLPVQVTDALGHSINFAYTGADLASITDALGRQSTITTDTLGRVLSTADPLRNTTQFNRDAMDRVQTVIDALGQTTTLSYDPNGNLLTVKDPRNVVQTYTYDSRNRRHTYVDPANKTETDNYDGMGNLTSVVDRKGQTTSIQYDGINRPTLITFQDASTIAITWDAGNRATKYVDSLNGTISRTYDGLDRLTQEVSPQGTVNYTFDNASRRSTMTVVGQPQVVYTFDAANRLTGITQGANAVAIGYDAANRLQTVTWPNGVVGTYTLDNANQLTGIGFAKGSNVIGTLGYGYDLAGRRTSLTGTLASYVPPMVAPSMTYDGVNRLTGRLGSALTYDANGNLTAQGATTYTWNARNQLVATSAGGASFQYDALGRRTSATVGGVTTGYQYDGLNPVLVGGSFMLAGLGLDENFARVTSGAATALLTDGLGSTVAMSNSATTTTATYGYSPYGETVKSGTDSTPLEYTGRENDGATGLYYYRARYYSPVLGRFISEDPTGITAGGRPVWGRKQTFISEDPLGSLAGINFYSYTFDGPTIYRDPSGKCPWCLAAGFVVGAGANILGTVIAGEVPQFADVVVAGLAGVVAVAGAGEIVAGTVVGGIAGVGFGVIGDLGIQSGFNLISLGEIISPAKADDLPIGNQPVVPAICR